MQHGELAPGKLEQAGAWADTHLVSDCSDGVDNDLDGQIDYPEDEDCESASDPVEESDCGSEMCKPNPHGVASAQDCTLTGTGELGAGLVNHSCYHTMHGPFVEVVASVGATATEGTPNVDAVHTHYSVRLTADEPNAVTYEPRRSGTWVVFGNDDISFGMFEPAGDELVALFESDVPLCERLPLARVFQLEASTT